MSARTIDPLTATWWPDLLSLKDDYSYDALAARFGVSVHVIRSALERAGVTKRSLPRGPKAGGASRVPPADPFAKVRDLLGTMPDRDVAQLAGLTEEAVKAHRKAQGISRYRRPASAAEPAPAAPAVSAAPVPAAPVVASPVVASPVVASPVVAPPVVAPVAAAPVVAAPVAAEAAPVDILFPFRDQFGKVADQTIADAVGIARTKVGEYRRKHGFPAYSEFRHRPRGVGAASAPEVAEPVVAAAAPVVAAPVVAAPVVAAPARVAPTPAPAVTRPVEVAAVPERRPAPVVAPPAAPAAVARVAPVAAPVVTRQGYTLTVAKDGQERRFCIMGTTLIDAVSRAQALLAARSDGPWVVQGVVWIAEGLE